MESFLSHDNIAIAVLAAYGVTVTSLLFMERRRTEEAWRRVEQVADALKSIRIALEVVKERINVVENS